MAALLGGDALSESLSGSSDEHQNRQESEI